MAEQSNIFEKLDEIKSGIDEIKPSVQDEAKLKEFIANAERVFVYCGQKSEFAYDKKIFCVSRIVSVVLMLINIVIMALPMIFYRDNAALFCIPFIPVAVFNILYIAFCVVQLIYIKSQGYEVSYDKIKVPWLFYLYDDNGIICGTKQKLPFKILKILTPLINILAGFAAMMLCLAEILVGGLVFGCVFVLILILIFLDVKTMNGYILYFRDKNNTTLYGQLSKFMSDNNLK